MAVSTVRHGTASGWHNHRCRCDRCRAYNREIGAAWRAKVRAEPVPRATQHGLASTYRNYACRCQPCRDAVIAAQRELRARKKAAT